jgi:hypothetical protein
LEVLDASEAFAQTQHGDECWRRQRLARDPDGDLRRARNAARQAVSLARSRDQKYRATELLDWVEHDLGDRKEELRQARRLMQLEPWNGRSLAALHNATGHNEGTSVELADFP